MEKQYTRSGFFTDEQELLWEVETLLLKFNIKYPKHNYNTMRAMDELFRINKIIWDYEKDNIQEKKETV